jgi:hypothetical protein
VDLELVSRVAMNASAGLLIVPAIAALVRVHRHKHDLQKKRVKGPARPFEGPSRGIVRASMGVIGIAVVVSAAVQLGFIGQVWFAGAQTMATVSQAELAWRAKGGDYYAVAYRFEVPGVRGTYTGEARSTTEYRVGEAVAVRYLPEQPDRNVIDDRTIAFGWPVFLLVVGLIAPIVSRML